MVFSSYECKNHIRVTMLDTISHAEHAQMLQPTASFDVKSSIHIAPNFNILQTCNPHFFGVF